MLRLSRLGLVLLTGCSIVVDGELANRGETADCADAADGTACGSGLICLDGECDLSICGDGFVDVEDGEECDDENRVDDDGCDADCTFSCVADVDCGEGVPCGGSPSCDLETHACVVSDPPADGSTCDLEGEEGVCRAGECVSAGCGNGLLEGDEVCDDGNDVERDGCDNDCTLSCLEDVDCVDETVCNGSETCDTTTNACVAGEPLDCADEDPCTEDVCDPETGCANPIADADGDGQAPTSLGTCGTDCDDTDDTIFDGAEELCDGEDNDCNGVVDDSAPTWYIDCDGDGFAADTTGAVGPSCDPPTSPPAGCAGGAWTSVRPVGQPSTDCNDANGDVFPGQTRYFDVPIPGSSGSLRYDYDCSGGHSRQYGCVPSGSTCSSGCGSGFANRDSDSNPNGCTFICIIGGSCFAQSPDCGVTARYNSCGGSGRLCTVFNGSRRQACR